jgi:protein-tyrosine phosphatase
LDWITDKVAIGNSLDARDAGLLEQHAFRSVLSLDGTLGRSQAAEFGLAEVASYRLIDEAGNDLRVVERAVDDLRRLAESLPPVLVQCHAGRSRSATVVAAYLMRARHMPPDKAVAFVAARRAINITPALLALLCRLEPRDADRPSLTE